MTCKMEKKSFILHLDSLSVLDELTDAQAGKLFKAIKAYHLRDAERCYQDGDTGFDDLMKDFLIRVAFAPFKAQFERDREAYDEISTKRREAGSKGGAPKGNRNAIKQIQPNQPNQANACINKQNKLSDSDSKSDSENNPPYIPPQVGGKEEEGYLSSPLSQKDGVQRNYKGLLDSMNRLSVPSKQQEQIIKLSNYGELGHEVWGLIRQCEDSLGKNVYDKSRIKLPGLFMISELKKKKNESTTQEIPDSDR